MPDRTVAASATRDGTAAWRAARDGAQAIDERLQALGPGAQAVIDALVDRLAALPPSANFAPFAALGDLAAPTTQQVTAQGGRAKRPGRSGAAAAKPASLASSLAQLPKVAAAAAASLARGVGTATEAVTQHILPGPALLQALASGALTPAASTPKPSEGNLLSGPAEAARRVADWLTDRLDTATAPARALAQVDAMTVLAGILAAPAQFDAQRGAGAKPGSRRADRKPADATTTDAGPRAAPKPGSNLAAPSNPAPTGNVDAPAPRAPSKLLPPAIGAALPEAGDRAEPPAQRANDDEDPIDAMTRALVDQAWLRGVDLR